MAGASGQPPAPPPAQGFNPAQQQAIQGIQQALGAQQQQPQQQPQGGGLVQTLQNLFGVAQAQPGGNASPKELNERQKAVGDFFRKRSRQ